MTVAAKNFAQVAGDRSDIATLAADHLKLDVIGVGAAFQGQAFYK